MRLAKTALLLGLGVLAGSPEFLPAAESSDVRAEDTRDLRAAIERLQHARYDLALAERKFSGERADSLQQTQFALEQLFAAVNDDRWKEEDRKLWEKQKREIEAILDKRTEVDTSQGDQFVRAESGLKNLRDARRLVDRVEGSGFGGHKSKAIVHIDEAIKAMEKGINKAREEQRSKD